MILSKETLEKRNEDIDKEISSLPLLEKEKKEAKGK
jgi:hypothetical protein